MNASGIIPLDLRILVKPDEPVTKIGSIHIPEASADKAKYSGVTATLIAHGENAFRDWQKQGPVTTPKPGDRLLFAQYSGARRKGADGLDYIIMNDEDLLGILEAEFTQ